jgi:translocation and assembly module TamA
LRSLLQDNLDLQRAIKLPEASGVSDAEWSRLIAAMPAQAVEMARTAGYYNAQAEVTHVSPASDGRLDVTLKVEPGDIARVGKVHFEVQGQLADLADDGNADAKSLKRQLQDSWSMGEGARFTVSDWESAKTAVIATLRSSGYANATWSGTAAEVDPTTRKVRIFVVVDSGPLYKLGSIEVTGLQHQKADEVRAMAGMRTGTAVTEQRLQNFQERLTKTSLYDQVTVSLDPDPDQADHAVVHVALKETPLQSATTGIGISGTSGPRATLEHKNRRLFDYAITATNKFEYGKSRQDWEGEISTHLNERLERDLVGGEVERLLTDDDMVITQKIRVGRAQERANVERMYYGELDRSEECGLDGHKFINCESLRAISLDTSRTARNLDNALLPTRGYALSTQFGGGLAEGSASKKGPFMRAYGRLTGYQPIGSWYAQGRLELGRVFTPPGVQVPDTLRFRAGGDNSVRGYAWRSLSPTDSDGDTTGGRMLFTTSVEMAHPLKASMPNLWGAVFIDAGRAADKIADLNPALGYGVGLRYRSPVGPLSIDWAWGQEVHRGRIHLNVGVVF